MLDIYDLSLPEATPRHNNKHMIYINNSVSIIFLVYFINNFG